MAGFLPSGHQLTGQTRARFRAARIWAATNKTKARVRVPGATILRGSWCAGALLALGSTGTAVLSWLIHLALQRRTARIGRLVVEA